MTSWRDEYLRRVAEVLAPEHAAHGFRAEARWEGYDGSGCETCGDGSITITVTGDCPCGSRVFKSVYGQEDVATFMQKITDE